MSQIYKFTTTMTVTLNTGAANTHRIPHGLLRQLLITAQTSGTIFRANITDDGGDIVRSYEFAKTQINDDNRPLPVTGIYTLNITNASADGQFRVKFVVQE